MNLILSSFGFKYGIPHDATCIWDVRFLPNPYWVEVLRGYSGLQSEVASYVIESAEGKMFLASFVPLVLLVVQENRRKGKKEIHLAIGCTGGRHRSVAVVEALARELGQKSVAVTVRHRDIENEVG